MSDLLLLLSLSPQFERQAMLDHGLLNTPLASRVNIEREIERHKAETRRQEREDAKRFAESRKQHYVNRDMAHQLIADLAEEQVAELARKTGAQKRSVRKMLREAASKNPEAVLRAMQNTN